MIRVRLAPESMQALRDRLSVVAVAGMAGRVAVAQVRERFDTNGQSGGVTWPAKTLPTGGKPLHGHTLELKNSFKFEVQARRSFATIIVYSDSKHVGANQEGTVGKGGTLPEIVPKPGKKALFIALSERAQASQTLTVAAAALYRRDFSLARDVGPIRAPLGPTGAPMGLRKGKLMDGKLYVYNEATRQYVEGMPDFIFLSKVNIPPRPMLPTSPAEQERLGQSILSRERV